MNSLEKFKKKKDFLICIDSDGCAMDTMDIKHIKCFGPCMINQWNLEKWKSPILKRWNEVNLYTLTRGINRFKGLALALEEINERYIPVEGLNEFIDWTHSTKELSNESLEGQIKIQKQNITCLKKALDWSRAVNASINELKYEEKLPFDGVYVGIKEAKKFADVAIVSSANEQAVLEEWKKHGLLDNVDIVLTQNTGSKAYCISRLVEKGYDRNNVLMVGDAVGDLDSAKSNNILYYLILVKKENQSWSRFTNETLELFISNAYKGKYEEKVIKEFKENLSGDK